MCGIIACRTHAPAIDYLLTALRRLEYRGYDSAGVAVRTTTGDVVRFRTVGHVDALNRSVAGWAGPELDGTGIGHTRWATHGPATEGNAHPHSDCGGRISLVHNGIIENAVQLRHALALSGHHFTSDVDSEVLCHLIEDQLAVSGDLPDAVQAALTPLEGSWALAVLEKRTGRIVVAARRSPLLIAHSAHGDFATSDIAAVTDWVDRFTVLEDDDVVELTGTVAPARSGPRHPGAVARCPWRSGDVELNGYVDHMAKEIDEQPAAAARVLDELGDRVADGSLWRELGCAPFDRVHVIGCGTSLNAGQVIANLLRRVGGLPVRVTVASEAGTEISEAGTLRLAISQSGETADVLRALDGLEPGDPVLAITNNAHSTLARCAAGFITCSAGPEVGVAATKTFVCQVIAGTALALSALVDSGRLTRSTAAQLVDELRRMPDRLAAAATVSKCLIPPIAEEVSSSSGFVFISKGNGLPYAAEGALKLKELTYRWTECCPAGELKHGPLALIGDGTPVVVVDNGDPKMASSIAEIATRGGRIISVGNTEGCTIPLPTNLNAPWGPLESVLPMQILARTIGLSLGCDVDKPRNLAKSVTVD